MRKRRVMKMLMSSNDSLVEWVREALEGVGALTQRNMFGGVALYLDGRIFGMIADDALWFKCDAESAPLWDAADCPLFTYDFGDGKMSGTMNYRRVPEDAYDDCDVLRHWATIGHAAALRAPAKKMKIKKHNT